MEVALRCGVVTTCIEWLTGATSRIASGPARAGIAAGLLLGLSTLPWRLGFFAAFGLIPLLAFLAARASLRQALLAGFLCGLGWFGVGFAWLPFVAGGTWRTWLIFVVFVPLASLSCAAFAAALALLRHLGVAAQLAAVPTLWLLVEQHQAVWIDGGVPWLRLAHGLAAWPLAIQPAALGGVGLLSAWLVAANVALVPGPWIGARARCCLLVALLLPLALGAARVSRAASGQGLRIAAVQPAVPQHEKFDSAHFDENLRRLLSLSEEAVAQGATLVVWPESAYERPYGPSGFDPLLAAAVRDLGVPVITGARRRDARERDPVSQNPPPEHNSALVLDAEGTLRGIADKAYPVPVFEAEPRSTWSLALARRGFWPGHFRAGPPPDAILLHPGLTLGVVVCVDVTQSGLVRGLRQQGARLLINPSNEALSGAWSAIAQARIARLRAVESGAPVIRVANTGPSEWIDARGVVVGSLPAGARVSGVETLALAAEATPFVRLGDAPSRIVIALPFFVVVARRARLPVVPWTRWRRSARSCESLDTRRNA